MIFKQLSGILQAGSCANVFTIIDSQPAKSALIGTMLLFQNEGVVSGKVESWLTAAVEEAVLRTSWKQPFAWWINAPSGERYRVFWDRVMAKRRAVVLGGGHISLSLVQMLTLLDFDVTVVDDRPEFANRQRFSGAAQVICNSFSRALQEVEIDSGTAVVIVTRGHRHDLECLRAVIDRPAGYLGMIGSRKRVREMLDLLREEGLPKGFEERFHSPIGLRIRAETPAEIAVSIAAEVVAVFRKAEDSDPVTGRREN
ncbi:MAG TPA: XdhC family protein [Patescibacteria group bacterium]|nr:XdhC family protein [Patescibacteria group bacterium]